MNAHRRPISVGLATAAALAVGIPAGALADSIGPHSSFYSTVSPKTRHVVPNAVNLDVHRTTGSTLVNVSNKCLGTFTLSVPGQPSTKDSKNATITTRLRHGKLSFHGRARLIAGQGAVGTVRMKLRATVTARRATGTATFPGTKCPRIDFVAPLRERTK
jgi:hypothetical protein